MLEEVARRNRRRTNHPSGGELKANGDLWARKLRRGTKQKAMRIVEKEGLEMLNEKRREARRRKDRRATLDLSWLPEAR